MFHFEQRKFSSLPKVQQHKKCAELLRFLYETKQIHLLYQYNDLANWMGENPPSNLHEWKVLSDQYHYHLRQANQSLKEHRLLPKIRKGDQIAKNTEPLPILIYLDQIRSAHNVGSILRTAEAFSLGTVHFSNQTPFADHKQVQDAAMGAEAWVSCKKGIIWSECPRPIIALETSAQATTIYNYSFPKSFTLILGNEEYGCSDESLREADHLLEIPLFGRKNSLNVANAFAIAASLIRFTNFK